MRNVGIIGNSMIHPFDAVLMTPYKLEPTRDMGSVTSKELQQQMYGFGMSRIRRRDLIKSYYRVVNHNRDLTPKGKKHNKKKRGF